MAVAPLDTFIPFPPDAIEQSIPARWDQQVVRYSGHPAVRTSADSLTYGQLDALANRIAHGILARRGEGSEPIGLLMSQGARLIAAILGILKAGKLYVPMDPSHPAARTSGLLEDAGARLVIAERTDRAAPIPTLGFDELTRDQPDQAPALALLQPLEHGREPEPRALAQHERGHALRAQLVDRRS